MFHDILSSRGIVFGFAFFVLIVGGTQWYSWHVRRSSQAELDRTNRTVKQLESQKNAGVRRNFESIGPDTPESLEIPIVSDETQSMPEEKDVLPLHNTGGVEIADPLLENIVGTEEGHTEVPVSPFGFGSYPEVPPDYPSAVVWRAANHGNLSAGTLQSIELLDRVLVKLWSEGERGFKGGIMAGSKVYPHYHNTAYVRYAEEAGYRYISEYQGGPDLPRLTREQLRTGKFPAGIRIINMDSAGIDAYRFLDLK